MCAKGYAKGFVGLGVEDLGWGRGKCASLYTGAAFEMDWWKFEVFQ